MLNDGHGAVCACLDGHECNTVELRWFQQDDVLRLYRGFAFIVCSIESTGTYWQQCRIVYAVAYILVMGCLTL